MSFNPQHSKFISTLENPELNVGQQLVRTAGKGSKRIEAYISPNRNTVEKTRALFSALYAFDESPDDITFAQLTEALQALDMKAVQVKDAPEWIYITPDANPGTGKWETLSRKTQFNLSWHVGSDSKVAISDEHNGGDGCFRVVGELVRQGTNIKHVMSNSRHRRVSTDWSHTTPTIIYPIMGDLVRQGYSVINVHGMASKNYGLLVNNFSSNFTRDRASLPTFIGIALARYFNDSNNKKFVFGGVLPGSAIINGKRKPLSPPNNEKTSTNSLYRRIRGAHNTNVIGHLVNNINARMANRPRGDSGKSCHFEFGIVRDGRGDLRKVVAAINLAAFWMNNYKPEFNPWTIVKNDPNFDMLKYGDLYHLSPEVIEELENIATNDDDTDDADIIIPDDVTFDIDENISDPEFNHDVDLDTDEDINEDEDLVQDDDADIDDDIEVKPVTAITVTLLLSGGPSARVIDHKIAQDGINVESRPTLTP